MKKFIANSYCPLMTYPNGDVVSGPVRVNLGKVGVATTLATITAEANKYASKDYGENTVVIAAPYGRNITVASTVSSHPTKITVKGYDYLGQPMVEEISVSATADTAVAGKKAFKEIAEIIAEDTHSASVTVTINEGTQFGMPYRLAATLASFADGVKYTNAEVVGVLTAQSATSADPRGTQTKSLSAATELSFICVFDGSIVTLNDKEVGGYQGIPHYFA